MRVSLTRSQRALLFFLSASSLAAWFSGIGERVGAQDVDGEPAPSFTLIRRTLPARVSSTIVRDPFVAPSRTTRSDEGPAPGNNAPEGAPSGRQLLPVPGSFDRAGGIVVPNIADVQYAPAMTLTVRATIVGPNPVAYVQNGAVMDIVRVGDTLGERRVTKIDLRGIGFNDDSRLDLPDGYAATPVPARASGRLITLGLDDLRRLLQPRQALGVPGSHPADTATPAPGPAPSESYPTAGPLPTVNTQGLAPGANPTPNAAGPTPFPEPYPYAPPAH